VKGSGCLVPEETEENYDKPESCKPISQLRFELGIFRIQGRGDNKYTAILDNREVTDRKSENI
jgi:hypothetical protein